MSLLTDVRESWLFKAIADISVVHWLVTIVPGLVSGVAAAMHGKPLETVILYFVGVCALMLLVLHFGTLAWARYWPKIKQNAANEPPRNLWRLVIPGVALVLMLGIGWFANPKSGTGDQSSPQSSQESQDGTASQQPAQTAQPPSSTQTATKKEPKEDRSKTASEVTKPAAQAQSTYSVTNPSDSIVNQNSPNYGTQTINSLQLRIPETNIAKLAIALSGCSSGSTIASPSVENPSGLTEQDANNLATAFAGAHSWNYSGVGHMTHGQDIGPDGPIPDPVGIHIRTTKEHLDLANCVKSALKSIDVESVVESQESGGNSLNILVGNASKPPAHKTTGLLNSPAPLQAAPMSQDCAPGAYCAQSTGQSGGITGQVFVDTPPLVIKWRAENVTTDALDNPTVFPYEQHVIVSVNTLYAPVSLAIICDSEIGEVRPYGTSVSLITGISDKHIGFLKYSSPALMPGAPLMIGVLAKHPFAVKDVVQAKIP